MQWYRSKVRGQDSWRCRVCGNQRNTVTTAMEAEEPLTLQEVLESPSNPIESLPHLEDPYRSLQLSTPLRDLLETFKSFEFIVEFHSKSRNVVLFEEVRLDVARQLKRKFTRECFLKICWLVPDLLSAERMAGVKNDLIIVRLRPATGERIGCGLLPKEALDRETHFISALIRFEMMVHSDVLSKLHEPVEFHRLSKGRISWSQRYTPIDDSLEIPTFEPTAAVGGHLSPIPRGRAAASSCGPVVNLMARLRSQSPLRTLRPVSDATGGGGGGSRGSSRTPSLAGTPVRTRFAMGTPLGGRSNMFASSPTTTTTEFPLSAATTTTSPMVVMSSRASPLYHHHHDDTRRSPLPRRSSPLSRTTGENGRGRENGSFYERISPVLKRKRATPPQGVTFASSSATTPTSDYGGGETSTAKRNRATSEANSRPELLTPVPRRRGPTPNPCSTPTPFLEDIHEGLRPHQPMRTPLHFPLTSPVKGTPLAGRRGEDAPALDPMAETPLMDARQKMRGSSSGVLGDTPIVTRKRATTSTPMEQLEEEEWGDENGGVQDPYKEILDHEEEVMGQAKKRLGCLAALQLSQEVYNSYFGMGAKKISSGMKDLALKAERNKEVKEVKKLLEAHAERYRRQENHYRLAKWVLRSLEETYHGKDKVPTQIRSVASRLVSEAANPDVTDESVSEIIVFLGVEYPEIVKLEQSRLRDVQCVCLDTNDTNLDETYEKLQDLIEEAIIGRQRFAQQRDEILEGVVECPVDDKMGGGGRRRRMWMCASSSSSSGSSSRRSSVLWCCIIQTDHIKLMVLIFNVKNKTEKNCAA
eukprot:GHVS01038304.1.p1 GENE.GHVS01038304.1~~GHVS01038304.1.p1  ORF type:complete len:813 (-),score=141.92 GHVS01038304.1:289-2727(-)